MATYLLNILPNKKNSLQTSTEICWNKMCLTLLLESFDDNKVLKNCQLDMLIFVQVYKTIDKNLRSSLGSGRTKESKGINKKEA